MYPSNQDHQHSHHRFKHLSFLYPGSSKSSVLAALKHTRKCNNHNYHTVLQKSGSFCFLYPSTHWPSLSLSCPFHHFYLFVYMCAYLLFISMWPFISSITCSVHLFICGLYPTVPLTQIYMVGFLSLYDWIIFHRLICQLGSFISWSTHGLFLWCDCWVVPQ